jgi:hypothetical protein
VNCAGTVKRIAARNEDRRESVQFLGFHRNTVISKLLHISDSPRLLMARRGNLRFNTDHSEFAGIVAS